MTRCDAPGGHNRAALRGARRGLVSRAARSVTGRRAWAGRPRAARGSHPLCAGRYPPPRRRRAGAAVADREDRIEALLPGPQDEQSRQVRLPAASRRRRCYCYQGRVVGPRERASRRRGRRAAPRAATRASAAPLAAVAVAAVPEGGAAHTAGSHNLSGDDNSCHNCVTVTRAPPQRILPCGGLPRAPRMQRPLTSAPPGAPRGRPVSMAGALMAIGAARAPRGPQVHQNQREGRGCHWRSLHGGDSRQRRARLHGSPPLPPSLAADATAKGPLL